MMKMLTLFGKDIKELKFNELKRERSCQKFLLSKVRSYRNTIAKSIEEYDSELRRDKVEFFTMYEKHLEALIEEIDHYLDRRIEPLENANQTRSRKSIRGLNAKRRTTLIRDNKRMYDWKRSSEQDGFLVSWDRERFFSIAEDRGYFTEEAVTTAVEKELNLDRTRAKLILRLGRFTWGQVLCLGAFLQMTPKEFCDTFLAGYFVDSYGEYRADYENLCKEELLKRAVKPQMNFSDMVEVEVDSEGKPIDEEIWFDD